jgi:hypothetical protein
MKIGITPTGKWRIYSCRRYNMPNQATPNLGKTEKPATLDVHDTETADDKALDRVADRAAEKSSKREKSYDSEHDIFTK